MNAVLLLADLVLVVESAADCTFVTKSWAFPFVYLSRQISAMTCFTTIETNFCLGCRAIFPGVVQVTVV